MNTQKPAAELLKKASDELQAMIDAINNAPFAEIQSALLADLKLDSESDWSELHEQVDDLIVHARLADADSLRAAFALHKRLGHFLTALIELGTDESNAESRESQNEALPGFANGTWREEVNRTAENLIQYAQQDPTLMIRQFRESLEKMAAADFSFPLNCLQAQASPPTEITRLVSDICDRLVQQRVVAERKRLVIELAANSTKYTPPPGISAKARKKDGPTELTRQLFWELEHVRSQPYSEECRQDRNELFKKLTSPEKLLATFTNQGKSEQQHGAPLRLALPLDAHWETRAALLPPLDTSNSTINQWVEAALVWLICDYKEDFNSVEWALPIMSRIEKTGSLIAGLNLFLKEGFETLAGLDKK